MKIAIMTDVNAGLDYVDNNYGITVLRSSVNFKNEILVDGIGIKADEFYARIRKITSKDEIPSTSAPALVDIYDALDHFIEEGYTHVIHFPISFALSSTGPTVKQVAEEYEDKIKVIVIDTKVACYIQGYLAVNAYQMAQNGATPEQIIEKSKYIIEHTQAHFVVNELSYLVKNGRLSNAAGFLGTILKINPILELSKDGKIVSKEKVKTHKRAVEKIIDYATKFAETLKDKKIFVFHSDEYESATHIKEEIIKRTNYQNVEIHYITPAVGAHIGAGVLGIAVMGI